MASLNWNTTLQNNHVNISTSSKSRKICASTSQNEEISAAPEFDNAGHELASQIIHLTIATTQDGFQRKAYKDKYEDKDSNTKYLAMKLRTVILGLLQLNNGGNP
ncbi:hypothetical protein TNCV_4003721 [Trichonephila clavipes]|nr:hypothetical protein TNCV_4003721 [Trichonephila clavipes]